jgi:hypothetical protein
VKSILWKNSPELERLQDEGALNGVVLTKSDLTYITVSRSSWCADVNGLQPHISSTRSSSSIGLERKLITAWSGLAINWVLMAYFEQLASQITLADNRQDIFLYSTVLYSSTRYSVLLV